MVVWYFWGAPKSYPMHSSLLLPWSDQPAWPPCMLASVSVPLSIHMYCDVPGSPCLSKTGGLLETPPCWHVRVYFLEPNNFAQQWEGKIYWSPRPPRSQDIGLESALSYYVKHVCWEAAVFISHSFLKVMIIIPPLYMNSHGFTDKIPQYKWYWKISRVIGTIPELIIHHLILDAKSYFQTSDTIWL